MVSSIQVDSEHPTVQEMDLENSEMIIDQSNHVDMTE
jgi:hypothetical protein